MSARRSGRECTTSALFALPAQVRTRPRPPCARRLCACAYARVQLDSYSPSCYCSEFQMWKVIVASEDQDWCALATIICMAAVRICTHACMRVACTRARARIRCATHAAENDVFTTEASASATPQLLKGLAYQIMEDEAVCLKLRSFYNEMLLFSRSLRTFSAPCAMAAMERYPHNLSTAHSNLSTALSRIRAPRAFIEIHSCIYSLRTCRHR